MALLHDDPRVQAFVESELSALLEHEARHHDGMLDLLRQYVAAGGNKTRLAEAAHRSRPAVYKKLARLERILGADLSDPTSLMSLGVALMAHDLGRAPM
jgi:PucR family transcriptional regulator, purine catabolism regulatory protein